MFKKILEKLKTRKLLVVVLLLFFAINIFAIFNTFTEKTTSSLWDGEIAKNFSGGTGTAVDPYIINDGRELALFFNLINGEESEEYFNKFYSITNNIDLNGYNISFTEFEKTFAGSLNGNGYTLFNFKIDKYALDEKNDIAHFNLFDSLNSASIKNINFSDVTIEVDADDIINERPAEEKKNKTEDKIETKTEEKSEEKTPEKSESIVEETASLLKDYSVRFVQSEDTTKTDEENNSEPSTKTDETTTEEGSKSEEKTSEETKTDDKSSEVKPSEDTVVTPDNKEEPTKPTEEVKPETTKPTEKTEEEPEVKDYVSNITISLFRDVKNSMISNISLNNVVIKYSGDEAKLTSSLFVLNDIEKNTFENINLNAYSNVDNTKAMFSDYTSATLKNIIFRDNGHDLYEDYTSKTSDSIYEYKIEDGKIVFENNYLVKSVLSVLNNNSDLKWKISNNTFKIENIGTDGGRLRAAKARRAAPTSHASGTDGTVVYVNDYVADWDYYQGLNYTYSANGHIPTTANKNRYNENNLVYVQLNYYARDIDNQYRAALSGTENYNQFVYYKVYPVENNEVKVPLIDNPFTFRPYNKVFNGWITDYEDAVVELDRDIYQRYVTIPVTKTDNLPDHININIYATWTNGKITTISGNNGWNNAINGLDANGFHAVNQDNPNAYESITGLYVRRTVTRANYPNGAVDYNGDSMTGYCSGTCTYYAHPTGSYVSGTQYYKLTDHMEAYTVQHLYDAEIPVGSKIAGYFRQATLMNGEDYYGYYNSSGDMYTTGRCNNSNGCSGFYQMIPFYDDNGDPEVVINHTTYYYLTTRDTNIVVLTNSVARVFDSQAKPFTFTGMTTNAQGNAVQYSNNTTYFNINTRTLTCYDDFRMENMTVYSGVTPQSNDSLPSGNAAFIGNTKNTKLGRNLFTNTNNRVVFRYAMGSSNATINNSNFQRFKFEVESGIYNNIGVATRDGTDYTQYINVIGVFGNDYDRVTENPLTSSDLDVKYTLSGSWSGYLHGHNATDAMLHTTIKSGRYGTNKYDTYTGVYVGGQISGEHYSTRVAVFEGGWTYIVTGGPQTQSSNKDINDTQVYFKGGYADVIFGGAGRSPTYGNKIIQVTGGRINYSIFGGSNGVEGNNNTNYRGTIDGDSFVYVGGSAIIGDPTLVSNNTIESKTKVEAGSVFGIGNGNSSYATVGTMNNSNVIIDTDATINRNVYGGGNYGASGQNGTNRNYQTNVIVHGGTIKGSVYGGGNNNGAGTSSNRDNITITMDGGTVNGSVYGGSRTKGTVYGGTTVNILAGTISGDVYGGGEGGWDSSTNFGTSVRDNVSITIGDSSNTDPNDPTISGSVYGGSAYGTVGAAITNTSGNNPGKTNTTVSVVVESGKVIGSVFGGAKGSSTYTPHVCGKITVDVNDGTIGNVYGGFDQSGKPKDTSVVTIDGGTVTNAFGGGNQTSIDSTDISVRGGTVTTLYGGSNQSGTVLTTDVKISGGKVGTVFGGNNEGGTCGTTSVKMTNGEITTAIYGGGNLVATDSTKVEITGVTTGTTIPAVYGGGNKAGVGNASANPQTGKTEVLINGSGVSITNVYGGSNQSGTVTKSEITMNSGTVTTMYGGNNAGGQTNDTNIDINGGTLTTIYGGGNEATSGVTHVVIDDTATGITNVFGGGNKANCTTTNVTTTANAKITNVFGGSNQSGTVTTSNVNIQNGEVTTVYGGNNAGGQTTTTNVTMTTGKVTTIYGGGNEAISGTTHVTVNGSSQTIANIYGGGNKAATGDTNVTFNNGSVTNIFGAGNEADAEDTTVVVNAATGTITSVYGGGNKAGADSSNVTIGPATGTAVNVTSVYGGSNQSGDVDVTHVTTNKANISNAYGGNNAGGESGETHVTVNGSTISNVYGGGNEADSGDTAVIINAGSDIIALYGGGNQADVESTDVTVNGGTIVVAFGGGNAAGVEGDTSIKILGGSVNNNVYGGGNEGTVGGDTNVLIHNATVYGSAYAGGNGSTAIVTGDTTITVSGTSVIGTSSCSNYSNCSVFGGGNAAETGTVGTPANAKVKILGGTIYGNVYGGANTSKVYGSTDVNIGAGVPTGTNMVRGPVHIRGTVFGGGEANASGSTTYDFSFISVTEGVRIEIDGNGYNSFEIDGSIFGSGNASSSEGDSYIFIKNYGSQANPQRNISIQRATLVTIDNSAIVLSGTTDRTNEYSDVLFSLSRVTELDIKNNTTLYLENGANLLEAFKSLNADGTKATVTISDSGTVTKSTDNRLYMYTGRHLDIAKDQNATDMGEVDGMTFFGMYKYNNDDSVNIGIYGNETEGDSVDWSKVFDNVTSYVAGLHETAHDIEVDGFYTNFAVEETQKYDIDFITPTPPTGPLYMWIIGAGVIEYEEELTASRYSTLGSVELSLRDFTHPNTTFAILGFDYSELNAGVELIERQNVKKIADTSTEADNIMGISMETTNAGWLNNGQTSFVTETDPEDCVIGTTSYVKGNYSGAPSVLLYLHHSKNIATAGDMGKVKIQLMSIRQTGPLEKETKRLIITLNLKRTLYDTISYEGSMTAGRRYEMFASTSTNITSHSAISAYFALFATDENIYKTGYHRTLVSTFAFPENTKITMIDLSGNAPEYYYKVISASDYTAAQQELTNIGEVSYNVSMFEAMGAENSGVYYNDVTKNAAYYNSSPEYCEEEFIFIIDFADTNISTDYLNNKLLLEMRNASDATIYSVLAPQHGDLTYNIYANRDAVIDMSGTISATKIYNGDTFNVDLTIDYTQSTVGSATVFDTHYFDSKLGIKISLINSQGNVVTGTTLLGLNYTIDEARYDPNIDGTTRIKIADKVDSAEKWVIVNTGTSAIATGNYKLRIESFGSPDGIYYGLTASDMIEFNIEIINEIYGLDVNTTPEEMIINSETGKNENGENSISYTVLYNSGLTQPNIRFKLYRRNYNTIDDTTYSLVDAQDYFADTLTASPNEKEYIIRDEPDSEFNVEFETNDDLISGTYKMVFELYDDTALIGTVDKYFVIK